MKINLLEQKLEDKPLFILRSTFYGWDGDYTEIAGAFSSFSKLAYAAERIVENKDNIFELEEATMQGIKTYEHVNSLDDLDVYHLSPRQVEELAKGVGFVYMDSAGEDYPFTRPYTKEEVIELIDDSDSSNRRIFGRLPILPSNIRASKMNALELQNLYNAQERIIMPTTQELIDAYEKRRAAMTPEMIKAERESARDFLRKE